MFFVTLPEMEAVGRLEVDEIVPVGVLERDADPKVEAVEDLVLLCPDIDRSNVILRREGDSERIVLVKSRVLEMDIEDERTETVLSRDDVTDADSPRPERLEVAVRPSADVDRVADSIRLYVGEL